MEKAELLTEKMKTLELKCCALAVDRANQFGAWLSGDQSFQCGPMGNNVRGRFNQVFKDIREVMENYGGDEI